MQCRNITATLARRKVTTTSVFRGARPLPVGARTKTPLSPRQSAMPTVGSTLGRSRFNAGRFRELELVRARRTGRTGNRGTHSRTSNHRSNETRSGNPGSKYAISKVSGRSDGSTPRAAADAEERLGRDEFSRDECQQDRDAVREGQRRWTWLRGRDRSGAVLDSARPRLYIRLEESEFPSLPHHLVAPRFAFTRSRVLGLAMLTSR